MRWDVTSFPRMALRRYVADCLKVNVQLEVHLQGEVTLLFSFKAMGQFPFSEVRKQLLHFLTLVGEHCLEMMQVSSLSMLALVLALKVVDSWGQKSAEKCVPHLRYLDLFIWTCPSCLAEQPSSHHVQICQTSLQALKLKTS